jgi:hypothetical protein
LETRCGSGACGFSVKSFLDVSVIFPTPIPPKWAGGFRWGCGSLVNTASKPQLGERCPASNLDASAPIVPRPNAPGRKARRVPRLYHALPCNAP